MWLRAAVGQHDFILAARGPFGIALRATPLQGNRLTTNGLLQTYGPRRAALNAGGRNLEGNWRLGHGYLVRSGGKIRGAAGSNPVPQAGHCTSNAGGGTNTSSAFAVVSTDGPSMKTETVKPPVLVSKRSRRDWHWGQRIRAGSEVFERVSAIDPMHCNRTRVSHLGVKDCREPTQAW